MYYKTLRICNQVLSSVSLLVLIEYFMLWRGKLVNFRFVKFDSIGPWRKTPFLNERKKTDLRWKKLMAAEKGKTRYFEIYELSPPLSLPLFSLLNSLNLTSLSPHPTFYLCIWHVPLREWYALLACTHAHTHTLSLSLGSHARTRTHTIALSVAS